MAKKDIKIAQSVYFPTLSAGVGYDFNTREGSKINSSTGNTFNANAGIKQLIWNFGKSGYLHFYLIGCEFNNMK